MTDRLERLTLQAMTTKLGLHIGARIRQARAEAGLTTQQELADLLPSPINNQYVSKWENGVKPKDETLNLIAAALDRDVGWFYEGFEKPEPTPDPFASDENGDGDDALLARLEALDEAISELDEQVRLWRAEEQTRDVEARKRTAEGFQTILDLLRQRPA